MTLFFNKNNILMYGLLIAGFISGCTEFIEPSIDKKSVNLIAPANRIETTNYQLTFLWDHVPDAINYRLQIALPSFDRVERLLLDTTVITDKFTFTLDPGKYEWRVSAQNGSSQTPYTVRSFTVFPASLTGQTVQTVSPANLFMTTSPSLTFEWMGLFGATSYRLQVDKNNFVNENNLIVNETVAGTKTIAQLPEEGTFQYRVRAENQTENSKWSAVRSFSYDKTPPAIVVLNSPSNRQVVASPVRLGWTAVADADRYEVFVYRGDSTTPANGSFPVLVNANSYSFTIGASQETFTWRVRAIDKAGNRGELSDVFSFTIQ